MKLLGYLLLVSIVLAAFKAAVMALALAAVLAGLISLIRRPREALLALFAVATTFAFVAHPLTVTGILLFAAVVNRLRDKGGRLTAVKRSGTCPLVWNSMYQEKRSCADQPF